MKNAVFWDVTPCVFCKNRCFGGAYRFHQHGEKNTRGVLQLLVFADSFHSDVGSDTLLRNIGSYKSRTTSHPRRLHSSLCDFFSISTTTGLCTVPVYTTIFGI
jgi:hypothetical protein